MRTIKATLTVIGKHEKIEEPGGKGKGKEATAYILVLPDHQSGDPFRREERPIIITQRSGNVSLVKVADDLKTSSKRAVVDVEITGDRGAAYHVGTLHAVGEYDAISGMGGKVPLRAWFARNDDDDYRGGTAHRLVTLAMTAAAAAGDLIVADRPAGPHIAAMNALEADILPKFNELLRRVDEDPIKVVAGDWATVHMTVTGHMLKVANKVLNGR